MEYSKNETKEITWIEHIRKRPAMYIGDLKQPGFNQLLEHVLEDIISCALENTIVEFQFYPNNRLAIEVKNINTHRLLDLMNNLEMKYTKGFGLNTVLALSTEIEIKIINRPSIVAYWGQKGNFNSAASTELQKENNALISFTLDPTIFDSFRVSYNYTNSYLKQFAMLNPGLKIISVDKTTDELQQRVFYFPEGVFHQLDSILALEPHQPKVFTLLKIEETIDGYSYRIGICYSHLYTQRYIIKSYAGNTYTFGNGSLVDGIFDGIKLAVKELASQKDVAVAISKKQLLEDLTIVTAITGAEYSWYGSIKYKLDMATVRKSVKKLVFDKLVEYYKSHPDLQDHVIHKFRVWPEEEE